MRAVCELITLANVRSVRPGSCLIRPHSRAICSINSNAEATGDFVASERTTRTRLRQPSPCSMRRLAWWNERQAGGMVAWCFSRKARWPGRFAATSLNCGSEWETYRTNGAGTTPTGATRAHLSQRSQSSTLGKDSSIWRTSPSLDGRTMTDEKPPTQFAQRISSGEHRSGRRWTAMWPARPSMTSDAKQLTMPVDG